MCAVRVPCICSKPSVKFCRCACSFKTLYPCIGDWSYSLFHAVQAHPVVRLAVKGLLAALAITAVYQSQLYALWLQYIVAAVAAVLVAVYGFSRSSLSSSGKCVAAV